MHPGLKIRHYVLLQKLGEGGMAEVWKAHDEQAGTEVAVKVLSSVYSGNLDIQQRFRNEGLRQGQLRHPGIVPVFDSFSEDGRHVLVMAYIPGGNLEDLVTSRNGGLSLPEVVTISKQVLGALEYAHAQGVIHRDVKPSNILLDNNGTAYLTDFGVALAIDQKRTTRTGTVLGTPHYMSPEHILRPKDIDGRSDLYSFGVVLYEMLTGRPPFDSTEEGWDYIVKQAHVAEPPCPPRELNSEIPEFVEAVVLCALEKTKAARFARCEEMMQALEDAAAGRAPALPAVASAAAAAPGFAGPGTTPPMPVSLKTAPPQERRRTEPAVTPVPFTEFIPDPPPVNPDPPRTTRSSFTWVLAGAGLLIVLLTVYLVISSDRSKPQQMVRIEQPVTLPQDQPVTVAPPAPSVTPPGGATEPPREQPPVVVHNPPQGTTPVRTRDSTVPYIPPGPAPAAPPAEPPSSRPAVQENKNQPTTTPQPVPQETPPPARPPQRREGFVPFTPSPDPSAPNRTPAIETPAAPPQPPAKTAGVLIWSVNLKKGVVESLDASGASNGEVRGDILPGVPVEVEVSNLADVGFVEQPSPSNGWRKLAVRSNSNRNVVLTIKWSRL